MPDLSQQEQAAKLIEAERRIREWVDSSFTPSQDARMEERGRLSVRFPLDLDSKFEQQLELILKVQFGVLTEFKTVQEKDKPERKCIQVCLTKAARAVYGAKNPEVAAKLEDSEDELAAEPAAGAGAPGAPAVSSSPQKSPKKRPQPLPEEACGLAKKFRAPTLWEAIEPRRPPKDLAGLKSAKEALDAGWEAVQNRQSNDPSGQVSSEEREAIEWLKGLENYEINDKEGLRDSKVGLAVTCWRKHPEKYVADIAKRTILEWKEAYRNVDAKIKAAQEKALELEEAKRSAMKAAGIKVEPAGGGKGRPKGQGGDKEAGEKKGRPKKEPKESEEDKEARAHLPETAPPDRVRMELQKVLGVTDLGTMTVGGLRSQLEAGLGLAEDTLAAEELRTWMGGVIQTEIQKFVKAQKKAAKAAAKEAEAKEEAAGEVSKSDPNDPLGVFSQLSEAQRSLFEGANHLVSDVSDGIAGVQSGAFPAVARTPQVSSGAVGSIGSISRAQVEEWVQQKFAALHLHIESRLAALEDAQRQRTLDRLTGAGMATQDPSPRAGVNDSHSPDNEAYERLRKRVARLEVEYGQEKRDKQEAEANRDQAVAKLQLEMKAVAKRVGSIDSVSQENRKNILQASPSIGNQYTGQSTNGTTGSGNAILRQMMMLEGDEEEEDEGHHSQQPKKKPSSHAIKSRSEIDAKDLSAYSSSPSVWDACIVLGTEYAGILGTVLMILGLVLNVLLQLAFISFIGDSIEEPVNDSLVDALRVWRLYVGHDIMYADPADGSSLVKKMCAQDGMAAGPAANILRQMDFYRAKGPGDSFSEGFSGVVVCVLAVICWYITLGKEFYRIIQSSVAFLSVERGPTTSFLFGYGSYHLVTLATPKVVLVLFISITRLGLAVYLLYIGMQHLIYKLSLADMLLSAVAVELIMRFDEIFFHALASRSAQCLWKRLAAVPLKCTDVLGAELHMIGFFLIALAFIIVSFVVQHGPFMEKLDDAKAQLCGGDLDFVYTVDAAGILHWQRTTGTLTYPSMASVLQQLVSGSVTSASNATLLTTGWQGRRGR